MLKSFVKLVKGLFVTKMVKVRIENLKAFSNSNIWMFLSNVHLKNKNGMMTLVRLL